MAKSRNQGSGRASYQGAFVTMGGTNVNGNTMKSRLLASSVFAGVAFMASASMLATAQEGEDAVQCRAAPIFSQSNVTLIAQAPGRGRLLSSQLARVLLMPASLGWCDGLRRD